MKELDNLLEEAESDYNYDLQTKIEAHYFFETYFKHKYLKELGVETKDLDTDEWGDLEFNSSFFDVKEYLDESTELNYPLEDIIDAITTLCNLGVILCRVNVEDGLESLLEASFEVLHLDYFKSLETLTDLKIVKRID